MTELSETLIKVHKVTKDFQLHDQTLHVLKNASFEVPEGSFTIVHGPSGSGKTTLLNTITGMDAPTTGTVSYRGKDIYELTENELAHFRANAMGIVYQSNYWVNSLSVLENVALPLYFLGYDRENAERQAAESLRRVGMEGHSDTLPTVLSGGEQQRVAMARALVSNPSYIVADEPTGNLDSKNGDTIIELLQYFHKTLNRTIILVTHNESYLKYGTQVLRVKDGVVTESKPAESVVEPVAEHQGFKSQRPHKQPIMSIIETLKPIKLRMLTHMALANLKFKKFRSSLTILGVTIGIGAVFLLLSFGLGLQNLVQKQILGTDSVRVINVTSANTDMLKLDNAAVERFQNVAKIEKIGRQNTSAGEFKLDSASSDAVIYGIDRNYLELSNLTLVAGKQINTDEPYDMVINKSLLNSLGYDDVSKALGKKVNIILKLDSGDKEIEQVFTVVGIIDAGGGSAIYIPQAAYQAAGVNEYKQVKVVARDQESIPDVRQQLEVFGYETNSPLDTIAQVNRFFRFFNLILFGLGGIGMFIAVIGMLNTLTIALLERTKEIGLMIALGARRQDMRRLFITESLLLSVIGGIIGVTGSIILGLLADLVMNQISANRGVLERFSLFATPVWLIILAVAFMCGVGYVVSYIPAKRAGKINPIDALRRE